MSKHSKKSSIYMIKPLILLLGVLSFIFGEKPIHSTESFLFCIKKDFPPLTINRSSEGVMVDIKEINDFVAGEGIVNIEPWLTGAKSHERDGDIYLNRIYRAFVADERSSDIPLIVNKMNSLQTVLYSEHEYIRKFDYLPNDTLAEIQCSLSSVKARSAWDFWDIDNGNIPNGRHIILASVDTGVDYTHPDLQNNSWINQGEIPSWMFEDGIDSDADGYVEASEVLSYIEQFGDTNGDGAVNLRDTVTSGSVFEDGQDNDNNGYIDDILGWDCSGNASIDDNDPFPKEGVANNGTWAHGTHVAGILAASTDNDLGMASISFNSKFMSVKCSRNNAGDEPGVNDGYDGILYAAQAGHSAGAITIINNSWGGGGFLNSENAVINEAVEDYGAIVVSAAGNGDESAGTQEYGTHYPSSYENSISVCAMGCNYQWGNWATYHYTVDLAAPGEGVYSAIIGTGYEDWMGSSMASPNAASAIALLSAYHPTWDGPQLRARIEESANRVVYEENPDYETCNGNSGDDCFGFGMVDVYKAIGMDFSPGISIASSSLILDADTDDSTLQDSDSNLNPGETTELVIELENEAGWQNASSVFATLSTDNQDVTIINENCAYGNMNNGSTSSGFDPFKFSVDPNIELGDIDFSLTVTAFGTDAYSYSNTIDFSVEVTLYQENFPYDTNSEIRSTPIVLDLDNDGDNEIVFADYFGNVRMIQDGQEVDNDIFPYDTENQIWGSISSADVDLDGYLDFAVSSKSGHLYIFDINGLKVDYNPDRWLIATPVIGNIDSDPELEIVVGGYQSPNSTSSLYAINHDGSPVEGFPLVVGEKIKSGVALADLNDNGKDDIVYGTDGDKLYVLLDDMTIASGFPVDLNSNIQAEPAVLDTGEEKIIFCGSNDNNFYAINFIDGSVRFMIETGDDVFSSPSFNDSASGMEIYFGSDDGLIYGVDIDGNAIPGFPRQISNGSVVGSVQLSDLDNDGSLDLVAADDLGNIYAQGAYDGESIVGFPLNYQFNFSSSPQIVDYDLDNDLEIICGTAGDLVMIDMKYSGGNASDYWSLFKGNYARTGYYLQGSFGDVCSGVIPGDINYDSIINVLDIVGLVGFVLDTSGITDQELCAADINGDGILNVLDIVGLVGLVLEQ